MPKVIDLSHLFEVTTVTYGLQGYERTATKDIAAKASVNEVTLYRRFGTKGALICQAVSHVLETSPFGQVEGHGDLRTDLIAILDAYVATFRSYGNVVATLLIEAPRYVELSGVQNVLRPNLLRVAEILHGHQTAGRLVSGSPLRLTLKLIAPLAMLGLLRNAELGPGFDFEQIDSAVIADEFLSGHIP